MIHESLQCIDVCDLCASVCVSVNRRYARWCLALLLSVFFPGSQVKWTLDAACEYHKRLYRPRHHQCANVEYISTHMLSTATVSTRSVYTPMRADVDIYTCICIHTIDYIHMCKWIRAMRARYLVKRVRLILGCCCLGNCNWKTWKNLCSCCLCLEDPVDR